MWPFARNKSSGLAACLAAAEPLAVSCEVTVVSSNALHSPVTGVQGAGFWIEVLEQLSLADVQPYSDEPITNPYVMSNEFRALSAKSVGESLLLRADDGTEVDVSLGRARLTLAAGSQAPVPFPPALEDLADMVRGIADHRVPFFREQVIREGDRFRLTATVEPVREIAASGYRSGTTTKLVVRYDLAPLVLEELLAVPAW